MLSVENGELGTKEFFTYFNGPSYIMRCSQKDLSYLWLFLSFLFLCTYIFFLSHIMQQSLKNALLSSTGLKERK